MKKTLGLMLLLGIATQCFAQTHDPYHQSLVNKVNQNNIIQCLTEFEGFGIKTLGSQAEENTLNWLISHYQSWGYEDIETHQVNAYGETGYNLIVTKTGTVYPETFIIIDAHYDTINGPGTNDNGSGTAVLLEIARILADTDTEYSVKFIHFTAEEWGLIGSQQYVNEIVIPQNLDLKLVFNIDEVGGVAGMNNDTIVCEKDMSAPNGNNAASEQRTQELAVCMQLYSNLDTFISFAYGSDYVPFQEAGYVITGLYEFNESDFPHTPYDTIENMDPEYVYQVTKGSLGALAFFAKAYGELNTDEQESLQYAVYPNPADEFIILPPRKSGEKMQVQLFDSIGKLVRQSVQKPAQELKIVTTNLQQGIYFLKIGDKTHKVIVQHK